MAAWRSAPKRKGIAAAAVASMSVQVAALAALVALAPVGVDLILRMLRLEGPAARGTTRHDAATPTQRICRLSTTTAPPP